MPGLGSKPDKLTARWTFGMQVTCGQALTFDRHDARRLQQQCSKQNYNSFFIKHFCIPSFFNFIVFCAVWNDIQSLWSLPPGRLKGAGLRIKYDRHDAVGLQSTNHAPQDHIFPIAPPANHLLVHGPQPSQELFAAYPKVRALGYGIASASFR